MIYIEVSPLINSGLSSVNVLAPAKYYFSNLLTLYAEHCERTLNSIKIFNGYM